MTTEIRICQNCKKEFTIEPEDFAFYEKMGILPPPASTREGSPTRGGPTWCPECRSIRRMVFYNQSNLFHKKEKRTGAELFSTYPEAAPLEIYAHDFWWSDAWNPMEFGRAYDPTRPFLDQVAELSRAVPWPSVAARNMVRSEYSNQAKGLKDCYLCFDGSDSENCLYMVAFFDMRECMDISLSSASQLCYEMFEGGTNYQCFFCANITQCRNLWLSEECTNCSDCVGCVGLRNKQYCIFNEPHTKEEYFKKCAALNLGSFASLESAKKRLQSLALSRPHKFYHGHQNADVRGDYIYWSKDAKQVLEVLGVEQVRYSEIIARDVKDCSDYTSWGEHAELLYECVSCGDRCRNLKFCFDCWPAMRDSEYCMNCHSSSDLFGCVGLRNKQYCILNRQYARDAYLALREKIISDMTRRGEYGEFFPPRASPLAYNESVALDYYPKTKEQAEAWGATWRERVRGQYKITRSAQDLPDHIADAPDSLPQEVLACARCGGAYRVLDQELAFLRRFGIPLPRLCVRCRHEARLAKRNPRALFHRQCMCDKSGHQHTERCPNEFETSYASSRPEIIYCERCYQLEVA